MSTMLASFVSTKALPFLLCSISTRIRVYLSSCLVVSQASYEGGDARGGQLLAWGWGCAPATSFPRAAAGGEAT